MATLAETALAQAKPGAGDCPVIRRFTVTHGTMNMVTGELTHSHQETKTGPCHIPLFGKQRTAGICHSCAEGWETEGNVIVR